MSEKAPEAFRTISEVADELDLPQHVLRFWETRFAQIKPMKRGGGRRYYRPEDVDLLRGIRHILYGEGYTIKGAQRVLKERGVRHVAAIGRGEDPDAVHEIRPAGPTLRAAPVADPLSEYAPKRVREQIRQAVPVEEDDDPADEDDDPRFDDEDGRADELGADADADTDAPAASGPAEHAGHARAGSAHGHESHEGGGHETTAREDRSQDDTPHPLDRDAERALRAVLYELQDCRRILRDLRAKAPTG